MAHVVFWEKPGCSGNARQRAALHAAGHQIEVRDLLREAWTPARLRPFFGERPVAEWFNPLAPAVRDGLIDPATFDEAGALAAMISAPLLIRRPLLQSGDTRMCGFDPAQIDAWIGLTPGGAAVSRQSMEACAKGNHMSPCPPPHP